MIGLIVEDRVDGLADGWQSRGRHFEILESNNARCMQMVAMAFAGQLGVVVVGLVLHKTFAVVHFPELEKPDSGRFSLVLFEVFQQAWQFRQFLLGLSRHEGTEQEQSKEEFGDCVFHCEAKIGKQ